MTRIAKNLHERLGQAVDDPDLAKGHLRKVMQDVFGSTGTRAVTTGRGNPVGALFPIAPPPKSVPASVPVAKHVAKPVKKKRPKPVKTRPKPRDPILTKQEALAMGFRRWIIRTRAAEAKALAKAEAKAEAQHHARLERREGTSKLAKARIEACARHPTPFAVQQLVGIASNENLGGQVRVEAAKLVLRLGQGSASESH